MSAWSVQDAARRFDSMLETCLREGPQVISKLGVEVAILVSIEDWRRSDSHRKPSLKELLLTDEARGDLNIPPRGKSRHRAPPTLDD